MPHVDPIDASLRLLAWYREMGADAAVGADAIDWLARGDLKPGAGFALPQQAPAPAGLVAPPPRAAATIEAAASAPSQRAERRPPPVAAPASSRAFAPTSPDAAVAAARAAANAAPSIEALADALTRFDGCGLKATAKHLCFYRGAAKARLMIVGEAPGREDDLAGQPFSGPAGELLEKMLAAIGVTPNSCHITNAVYWRPPGNRHPTPQELDVCQPFLERQTALVAPDVLLLLGASAARQVMDISDGIMRVRGKWRDAQLGGHAVRAIATLAPTYLLKAPSAKQNAWRDMLAVKAALN